MQNITKIQPIRMCCACRVHKEKTLLVRFVVNNENIVIDNSYKIQGRGIYICRNIDCFKKARKTKILERTLGKNIPENLYNDFEEYFYNEK